MKSQSHLFPIILMARLLRVSVSRFYDWLKRGMSKRSIQRNQQTILVKIAHEETKQSYGYVRLTKHLQAQGIKISTYAVRQIKKSNQLYCKRHKRFKRTTNSDHNRSIYDNLLKQQFSMTKPNLAWSSDITYIWTAEGWLYLAAVKDLYTFAILRFSLLEYALSATMESTSIPASSVFFINSGNCCPSPFSPEVTVAAVIILSSLIAICVL